MDRAKVGLVFRQLRKSRGMSQEVLSGLAGIDRSHYSKIELGQCGLSLETMLKIAYALDKKPHEVMEAIEKALEA